MSSSKYWWFHTWSTSYDPSIIRWLWVEQYNIVVPGQHHKVAIKRVEYSGNGYTPSFQAA